MTGCLATFIIFRQDWHNAVSRDTQINVLKYEIPIFTRVVIFAISSFHTYYLAAAVVYNKPQKLFYLNSNLL